MLAATLLPALNRVLDTQPNVLSRLQAHAGKFVCLALPGMPLNLEIVETGHLIPAPDNAAPALTLTPDLAALPRLLTGGALAELFRAEGDGVLAAELSGALHGFDWVLALRPWLGDMAATRADQFLKEFLDWKPRTLDAAGRNLAEYAVYEANLLADPMAVHEFIAGVDRLREDADRLEARLALLESRRPS
ncbi:MAG: hypothetical protein HZB71_10975 [Betaproteobacteria bacterium]|nr:hypothetical protein [Betaproteobacteria bacterium]